MSDYHILGMHRNQDEADVVFHIDIPAANNAANVSYRTALVEQLGGSTISRVPGLAAAEQTQLDTGERFEVPQRVKFDANLSNTQKQDAIEAAYTARTTQLLENKQNELEFWGLFGDVA